MKRLVFCSLLTMSAFAQNFNIDMDVPAAHWGGGAPAATFGGAADQPGAWTAVTATGQTYQLLSRLGIPTSATIEAVGVSGTASRNDSNATGDFADLMEDGLSVPTPDVSLFFNIAGLSPGKYFFYVYGGTEEYGDDPETFVSVLPFIGDETVGGHPYGLNQFDRGRTHLRYPINVGLGATLSFRISTRQTHTGAMGVITGMQIQKLPERLYVNASAPLGGDGRTWATAFNTIQAALDQARDWNGEIDEIWVAQGVYYPTDTLDQAASIDLPSGLADVYGGFAGTETSFDQRDPVAHPTTLSGNIGGPLPTDNSDNIVAIQSAYGNYGDEPVVLDGFTIIAGSGAHFSGAFGQGAGLVLIGGDAVIRNCRFLNNEAADGAATFANQGTMTFVNCEFLNNSAASGGGAFGNTVIEPNPGPIVRFINCRFHKNDADSRGGALSVTGGTTTLVNCVLTGNTAFLDGGAIHATAAAHVELLSCTIAGNRSSSIGGGAGGGLWLNGGASATLVNTILWDNAAASGHNGVLSSQVASSGGAISVNYCTVQHYLPLLLPGNANNGLNPQFVNATGGDGYGGLNDDLRLAAGSPLIDSGSNLGLGQDWGDLDEDGDFNEMTPLDLMLNPRRVDDPAVPNTSGGSGTPVDRGAYEAGFQVGDLNCDGFVTVADIGAFVLALTDPAAYAAAHPACNINLADTNGDGFVTVGDIGAFVCLLAGC